MKSGYESITWTNDKDGKEPVCSIAYNGEKYFIGSWVNKRGEIVRM